MIISFSTPEGVVKKADLSQPFEISITQTFEDNQPVAFGLPKAVTFPIMTEDYSGSIADGGSSNCYYIHLVPHCNGTHTECVGHILDRKVTINKILTDSFLMATVITVLPVKATDSTESYVPDKKEDDYFITRSALKEAFGRLNLFPSDAIIIRTLPNTDSKLVVDYEKQIPPFFSLEAIRWINECGFKHLLVDMPSIDRLWDEGILSNHHIYWDVPTNDVHLVNQSVSTKTITEMIFVPDSVPDGTYLLNIQIPPFDSDASPSRVFLYEMF